MAIENTTAAKSSTARIMGTPLAVAERETGTARVVVAADKFTVATISLGMNDRTEYARLFAAAPDLLDNLHALIGILEGDTRSYVQRALNSARAAIAKAAGLDSALTIEPQRGDAP